MLSRGALPSLFLLASCLGQRLVQGRIITKPYTPDGLWEVQAQSRSVEEPVSFTITLRGEKFGDLEERMTLAAEDQADWLTSEELKHYITPAARSIDAVHSWLKRHGIEDVESSVHGDRLTITSDTNKTSDLFDTTLTHHWHTISGRSEIYADDLVLPEDVSDHIVAVRGLHPGPHPHARGRGSQGAIAPHAHAALHARGRGSQGSIAHAAPVAPSRVERRQQQVSTSVPKRWTKAGVAPPGCKADNASWPCISQFYGYGSYPVKSNSESLAVINYEPWTDASIKVFEKTYFPKRKSKLPHKLTFSRTGSAWTNVTVDDGEAVLDAEVIMAAAYELNISTILSGVDFTGNIEHLIEMPDKQRPGVVSVSYGQLESSVSRDDAIDFCNKVQQLAALGTTFVTASGDVGVSVFGGNTCPPFSVDFMSGCPYVVSVGATTNFSPERAGYEPSQPDVNNGWSTGGFSNYFPTPKYQKTVIKEYLKHQNATWKPYYNTTGRGYTDVSAFGQGINVATTAGVWLGGGTSASSPLVAAMFGRLNALCKARGRKRIGWVHPTLYSNPGAVKDIKKGGTYLCPDYDSPLGFPSRKGWDPATGLGSINFPGLVKAFKCG